MASSSSAAPLAAPPPTPSLESNLPSASSTPSDFLSNLLLQRLPPALSLSRGPLSATPPLISLSSPSSLLSASTDVGFFHLGPHPIPSHLALSAESTALSLLALPRHRKQLLFPANWPLGHDIDEDDAESLCLDSTYLDLDLDLDLDSLREFARQMEQLGLKVVEELASAVGFANPTRNDLCSLLWISDGACKPPRLYPYALGLHYQITCRNHTLLTDSARLTVSGLRDSVFLTIGDIAQVWSNGKLKKVIGRPFPSSCDDNPNSHCVTMSLLITLPVESTVYALVPDLIDDENGEGDPANNGKGEKRLFSSFSMEDYAWRVYHQRLLLKDPLLRYRI